MANVGERLPSASAEQRPGQRPRGRCVRPSPTGLLVSVAAHSAATPERAQRARFSPAAPLGRGAGYRISPPPLCRIGDKVLVELERDDDRVGDKVLVELERDDDRRGGSSDALRCAWSSRSGRPPDLEFQVHQVADRVAARRLGLALGTAGVAVERVSRSRWGRGSRSSSCGAQRRFSGLSTGRRRSRRSGKPTRSHGRTIAGLLSAAEPR